MCNLSAVNYEYSIVLLKYSFNVSYHYTKLLYTDFSDIFYNIKFLCVLLFFKNLFGYVSTFVKRFTIQIRDNGMNCQVNFRDIQNQPQFNQDN